jgi:hypothetical protein
MELNLGLYFDLREEETTEMNAASASGTSHRADWTRYVTFLALLFGLHMPAFAALGGDVRSIAADQAQMQATLKILSADRYTVHEIKSPAGTAVREYVSLKGEVFAVDWQGPFMPNLQQILGKYFQQYAAAVRDEKRAYAGRRPLNLRQPNLVVQTGGHMRAYVGRAYVPGMLPDGTTPDEIR